jgi:O-antigen ligase/tetratricopeptide (TPR) repeat protein
MNIKDSSAISTGYLVGRFLSVGIVVAAPWWFGGVYATTQGWLYVVAILALLGWLGAQLRGRASSTTLPAAIVPLACALVLGVLQLVPLGGAARAILSPGAAQSREALASEQSPPEADFLSRLGMDAASERQPLSLYPASTRRDLALLLLGVIVFFLGAELFRSSRAQLWLCGAIAVNGAALAFFGLAQRLTWNERLYWQVPMSEGGAPFGPFINRNNAGGFLNLCLAGAVGLAVWVAQRRTRGDMPDLPHGDRKRPSHRGGRSLFGGIGRQARDFLPRLADVTVVALCLAMFIVGGILCSLSRGATTAMIGAGLLTVAIGFFMRRHRLPLAWLGLVVAAGIALVAWVGMTGKVHTRLATLWEDENVAEGRVSNWRDTLKAVPDFWQVGSGLGTYRYVYATQQQRFKELWYYHAENQYVEALLEGGVPALALMLTALALVGVAAWRLLRNAADHNAFALGIVGVFALVCQMIAGSSDFGMHIPANFLLFALLCGTVCGQAAALAPRRSIGLVRLGGGRPLAIATGLALLVAGLWGCVEIRRTAAVETVLDKMKFPETATGASEQELLDTMDALSSALKWSDDDADAHYGMARLWTQLYRLRALEQLLSNPDAASLGEDRLWLATSLLAIHGRAHALARAGRNDELEQLRNEPVIKDHLDSALTHLVKARRSCPMFVEAHLGLAELFVLAGEPAEDALHTARVRRLAPADANLLMRCGILDFQAGRYDSAYDSWRQCLALTPRYLDDVLAAVANQLETPGTLAKVLPDSPELLIELARKKYAGEQYDNLRSLLLDRAERLASELELPADVRFHALGDIFALREDDEAAIDNYAQAVKLRPGEAAWHYDLARLYQRQRQWDAACEHATACAQMNPQRTEYRKLLRQVLAHKAE